MSDTTPLSTPACPREDCPATIDHWHDGAGTAFACARQLGRVCSAHEIVAKSFAHATRCYAPLNQRVTVKPDDVQHGDRVRVVIEGKVFLHPGDDLTDVIDVARNINMDTWAAEVYLLERPAPNAVERACRILSFAHGVTVTPEQIRATLDELGLELMEASND